jgi:hypothetical protein
LDETDESMHIAAGLQLETPGLAGIQEAQISAQLP